MAMEIRIDPNGDTTKIRLKKGGPADSRPVIVGTHLLRDRSKTLREALDNLNDYVRLRGNKVDFDPGLRRYAQLIMELKEQGSALHTALFSTQNEGARALLNKLSTLKDGDEILVQCSCDEVTLPLGFLYRFPVEEAPLVYGKQDFDGFWMNRYKITMLIEGSNCDENALAIEPDSFKSIYALHETEVDAAWDYLMDDGPKFSKLRELRCLSTQEHGNWNKVRAAFASGKNWNVVFVLAHSDGDWLKLADSSIACQDFADMLQMDHPAGGAELLILNCCNSATGGVQRSLLSSVAADGFCGLIGTEAEVLNSHALRCGTYLMWELCAHGKSLGEAFDLMQLEKSLFPLNLFYTCYADRRFRLCKPFDYLNVA
jgi:hypothetical protein